MLIIPAIDLIDGKCVRLVKGDYRKKTVYSHDPIETAKRFADSGVKMIHIVDLDGAKLGKPQNLSVVANIARAVDIPIELGGGIRDLDTVHAVFDAGVERVILGTAVLDKPAWFLRAIDTFGHRIVVGIDARNGLAAVKGWLEDTQKSALELAVEMKELGIQEIIYTDIDRDGMLKGPNLEALKLMGQAEMKLVASGGVSTLADIRDLRALASYGVYACIVGKALYTGDLDLELAVEAAEGHN
ncbi:MAG: 1-(5-phosphoribosyl)-5-[(5-phosphoribosylamino)methylideneamino]imidazole-4-carboxamide isomerase [Firmicutes bacterium]|nr:1-(5-phosphoribosyl)-5-[(5-phosphoribosylamino)methylideneamino]imidazole-4-carboxamide isomerase [Bacillota bacterium]